MTRSFRRLATALSTIAEPSPLGCHPERREGSPERSEGSASYDNSRSFAKLRSGFLVPRNDTTFFDARRSPA